MLLEVFSPVIISSVTLITNLQHNRIEMLLRFMVHFVSGSACQESDLKREFISDKSLPLQ